LAKPSHTVGVMTTSKFLKSTLLKKLLLFLAATIFLFLLREYITFRKSDREISLYFADAAIKPTFHFISVKGKKIHYAEIGADSLPLVVLVHGSPGSWDTFITLFRDSTLYRHVHLISVDRLGYGKSERNQVEGSLHAQAEAIAQIIRNKNPTEKAIVVGYSMGGAVVSRLAMDFPERLRSMILVSAPLDPNVVKIEWYRPFLGSVPMRHLLPDEIDVSNMEMTPLQKELASMAGKWPEVKIPVRIIHGNNDGIVSPLNAAFAKKSLIKSQVQMIPEMNHFLPWRRPALIHDAILAQLTELEKSDKK